MDRWLDSVGWGSTYTSSLVPEQGVVRHQDSCCVALDDGYNCTAMQSHVGREWCRA